MAPKLRVLFVPASTYWVTGTLAKHFAHFNPWIEATVISGPVLEDVFRRVPDLISRFDLVHFTCPSASQQWLPKFRGAMPCVTSLHHVGDWSALEHIALADAIIAGSKRGADDLHARQVDPQKVVLIPYGVDPRRFAPAAPEARAALRKRFGIEHDATVVGFFAKFGSNELNRKGPDVFVDAATMLKQRVERTVALIVGPGWTDVVRLLKSRGIACLWFPFVADDEVARIYQVLDFFWVTARVEGGPVTLLEAMATGVCCLTTPVGHATEVIEDGRSGFVMPFDRPEAFAAKSAELAADGSTRREIGRNARSAIAEKQDVAKTARLLETAYRAAAVSFLRRPGRSVEFDLDRILVEREHAMPPATLIPTPLYGLPEAMRRRVTMMETLRWSEHLILSNAQASTALRLILGQWARNPLSPMPVRALLRRFLPPSVVAHVVSLRKR